MSFARRPTSERSVAERLAEGEARLLDLSIESTRADWVHATYLSPDSADLAARAFTRRVLATVELAKQLTPAAVATLDPSDQRKASLLRLSQSVVAPEDSALSSELARRVAEMEGTYAKARVRLTSETEPLDLQLLSQRLAESTDPALSEEIWTGWHGVGRSMRTDFARYVELANAGARGLGFEDTGEMWRSKYDMPPTELAREVDRLWAEVAPLYRDLHAYVRLRLAAMYPAHVDSTGPIPAHLFGNMWAQSWENLYARIAPAGIRRTSDLTARLKARGITPVEMVRFAEQFFVSLGFDPLPATFWERSMFTRPRDREVVCHASAWDVNYYEDLRIKMCIDVTGEDFQVIHHELGHNYYQRAYRHQPFLFRDSAHDGFHEALGDLIGLSVTPDYLHRIGLAEAPREDDPVVGELLRIALDKVAFLPFGYAIDQWRWRVFSGEIPPEEYNRSWWELRRTLQGIRPPRERADDEFDPGAKYHVPASVPYLRYFLAYILQFQLHRGLARASGWEGPLCRFSLYGRPEAGARLARMMAMGQSRPWPEALEVVTGERRMSAAGLLEYFRPLSDWLRRELNGHPVGW